MIPVLRDNAVVGRVFFKEIRHRVLIVRLMLLVLQFDVVGLSVSGPYQEVGLEFFVDEFDRLFHGVDRDVARADCAPEACFVV